MASRGRRIEETEIIERIKALCEARSWTSYRLAKESGITYSTLFTMLNKANSPSIPTLIKICDGFGITLAQFFDGNDDRVLLSDADKAHLDCWNRLSEENQIAAEKFLCFLLSGQKQTEE